MVERERGGRERDGRGWDGGEGGREERESFNMDSRVIQGDQ